MVEQIIFEIFCLRLKWSGLIWDSYTMLLNILMDVAYLLRLWESLISKLRDLKTNCKLNRRACHAYLASTFSTALKTVNIWHAIGSPKGKLSPDNDR